MSSWGKARRKRRLTTSKSSSPRSQLFVHPTTLEYRVARYAALLSTVAFAVSLSRFSFSSSSIGKVLKPTSCSQEVRVAEEGLYSGADHVRARESQSVPSAVYAGEKGQRRNKRVFGFRAANRPCYPLRSDLLPCAVSPTTSRREIRGGKAELTEGHN